MELPSISIVTPTLNQVQYIEETIDSVLTQNYPKLEYIVMDGGSTDGTVEILKRYEGRLTWRSEKDRGQSEALNRGFKMSTGEVLAFINSDDRYEPGALRTVGQYFSENPEVHWITGKCRIIDHHGREIRKPITAYKNFWLQLKSYTILQILDYVSQPATFWRRIVLDTVGWFDEGLKYSMDYDFSLRAGKLFRLFVIDQYLASYRIHPASKAGASAEAQFITDLAIAKKHASSGMIVGLHQLHNNLVIGIYRLMMQRPTEPSKEPAGGKPFVD